MRVEEALLLDRLADGALVAEERAALDARLRSDTEFQVAYREDARLRGMLAALQVEAGWSAGFPARLAAALRQRGRNTLGTPVIVEAVASRPRRQAQRGWLAALAAAIALAALWSLLPRASHAAAQGDWRPPLPPRIDAEVTSLHGTVLYQSRTITGPLTASPQAHGGSLLYDGDRLEVLAGSDAEVRYGDGTRVALAGGTIATFANANRPGRIDCQCGLLVADVAPQQPGNPLVIASPQALATVIGTRLRLGVGATTTLAVLHGRVAFAARTAPAQRLEVASGGRAEASASAVRALMPLGGDETVMASYLALCDAIAPPDGSPGWERVPWRTDLWSARQESAAQGKPILLWLGRGHPLGLTNSDCLHARGSAGWLASGILGQCIPVACDSWFLSQRQDDLGLWFERVMAQDPRRTPVNQQGIFVVSSDGILLSRSDSSEALPQSIADGIAAYRQRPRPASVGPQLAHDARWDPQPPAGGLVLAARGRELQRVGAGYQPSSDDGSPCPPCRETLWLSAPERLALVEAVDALASAGDAQRPFPAAIAAKLATQALLDGCHGEAATWEPDELRTCDLTLSAITSDTRGASARVHGRIELVGPGRRYAAEIDGGIAVTREAPRTVELWLAALGEHQGAEAEGGSRRQCLLGFVIGPDAHPEWIVPPHGLRDPHAYWTPAP